MQTAVALLPNHVERIYSEMKGLVEQWVFDLDFKGLMRQVFGSSGKLVPDMKSCW